MWQQSLIGSCAWECRAHHSITQNLTQCVECRKVFWGNKFKGRNANTLRSQKSGLWGPEWSKEKQVPFGAEWTFLCFLKPVSAIHPLARRKEAQDAMLSNGSYFTCILAKKIVIRQNLFRLLKFQTQNPFSRSLHSTPNFSKFHLWRNFAENGGWKKIEFIICTKLLEFALNFVFRQRNSLKKARDNAQNVWHPIWQTVQLCISCHIYSCYWCT